MEENVIKVVIKPFVVFKEKVTGIKFATIQNLICSRNLKLQIAVSDKNLIETYFV